MKQLQLACIVSLSLFSLSYAESTFNYRQEFENFKKSPRYKAIFNEDANETLSRIQRDIENNKQLSCLQRYIRSVFWILDPVAISTETMPTLYTYIDSMCAAQHITTPTIFITRDVTLKQGFFNATAQKLLISSGAIIVGQKMLLETTDAELEAVIAHEIGHIKYNHINKELLITYLSVASSAVVINAAVNHYLSSEVQGDPDLTIATRVYAPLVIGLFLTRLIINKRFEKQADEFAYKTMGKSEGVIEFFEDLNHREKAYNDDFDNTYAFLQESRPNLTFYDNIALTVRYYLASFDNHINNAFKWLYYHTPYGAHPSPEARIEAARNYQASKAATESHN